MAALIAALAISAAFSAYGLKKKSLSPSGAAAAFLVGTIHFYSGLQFGATLIAFFLASSKATKYQKNVKAKIEEDYRENGQRNYVQVIAKGLGGCVLAALSAYCHRHGHFRIMDVAMAGFLGHYASCCADTFSSELGILSRADPTLITTGKVVPKGTNGGVTSVGTAAGCAGGAFMGLVFWLSSRFDPTGEQSGLHVSLVPIAILLGLLGTLLDSLLGATCQYTGFSQTLGRVVGSPDPGVKHISGQALLGNTAVNFVTATCISVLGAGIVYYGKSDYPYEQVSSG